MKFAYLCFVGILTFFATLGFIKAATSGSLLALLVIVGFAAWLISAISFINNSNLGGKASLLFTVLFGLLLIIQFGRRILFVFENQALDGIDENAGSPAAFVIGAVFELGLLAISILFAFLLQNRWSNKT